MSDQPVEPGTSQPKGPHFPLPSWNKLGEFLVNIMQRALSKRLRSKTNS
jgi:hypothetical protein